MLISNFIPKLLHNQQRRKNSAQIDGIAKEN